MRILRRVPTGLFALMMGAGGVVDILRPPNVRALIEHLGYPPYFPLILGPAKILGVIALLAPVPPRVREWAYAGFAIDLVAALISHLAVGDGPRELAPAVAGLGLLVASYLTRPSQPRPGT